MEDESFSNFESILSLSKNCQLSLEQIQELLLKAYRISLNSYVPCSKRASGASLLTSSGRCYTACKMENVAYPNTCCAVGNVVVDAISSELDLGLPMSEEKILACATMGSVPGSYAIPCGVCCELIREFGYCDVYIGKFPQNIEFVENHLIEYIATSVEKLLPFGHLDDVTFGSELPKMKSPSASLSSIKDCYAEKHRLSLLQIDGISVKSIKSLSAQKDTPIILPLIEAVLRGIRYAYVPYSNFPVCAAVLTETGDIFHGCNVECSVFKAGYCAERSVLAKAVSLGLHDKIKAVAIWCLKLENEYGSPCGACRQALVEFGEYSVFCLKYCGDGEWDYKSCTNYELLPHAFCPKSLKKLKNFPFS